MAYKKNETYLPTYLPTYLHTFTSYTGNEPLALFTRVPFFLKFVMFMKTCRIFCMRHLFIFFQEETNPLAGKSALASRYPHPQYNGIGRSTTLRSLIHVPAQDEVMLGGIMGNILTVM